MKKTVSLSVDDQIYEKYRKFCKENGIILSKQVELFMRSELGKHGKRDFNKDSL